MVGWVTSPNERTSCVKAKAKPSTVGALERPAKTPLGSVTSFFPVPRHAAKHGPWTQNPLPLVSTTRTTTQPIIYECNEKLVALTPLRRLTVSVMKAGRCTLNSFGIVLGTFNSQTLRNTNVCEQYTKRQRLQSSDRRWPMGGRRNTLAWAFALKKGNALPPSPAHRSQSTKRGNLC